MKLLRWNLKCQKPLTVILDSILSSSKISIIHFINLKHDTYEHTSETLTNTHIISYVCRIQQRTGGDRR